MLSTAEENGPVVTSVHPKTKPKMIRGSVETSQAVESAEADRANKMPAVTLMWVTSRSPS